MRHDNVKFANASGQLLAGRIDYPVTGDPIAFAVYAHCFTCTKNLRAIGRIAETLALHGIATLRFDFAGLGGSEGEFAETNFSTNTDDMVAAAAFLEAEYQAPELVIGHSLGGAVAIAAAARLAAVKAVVTIAAPASPDHIRRHIAHDFDKIEAEGSAEVMLAGRPVVISKQLLDDTSSANLPEAIAGLGRPLLILHSPTDNIVGIDNAAEIFGHARHPKSFVSLDTVDHLISDDADARYVAELIASWADRYTAGDLSAHSQPDFEVDAPESVTTVRIEQGFRTDIISNGFPLVADEPLSVGGTNTGPTPYDYLLVALGSCTAMTLRMYADKKEWPLETVMVRLSHRKMHAKDCGECESEGGFVDHISREVTITGRLDDAQRQRLLEIADRCPVHKTLHGEVVGHATLAGQAG